jgi:hypothetical protein
MFFFKRGNNDIPTLEEITYGGSIAHFSAALLVATLCFLSSAVGDCWSRLVVDFVLNKFLSETHDRLVGKYLKTQEYSS